jgi:hypothetical protein
MPPFGMNSGPSESDLMCCCVVHPGALCALVAFAVGLTGRTDHGTAMFLGAVAFCINLPLFLLMFQMGTVGLLVLQGSFTLLSALAVVIHFFKQNAPPPSGPIPKWPERAAVQEKWDPHRPTDRPAPERIQPGEPPQDQTDTH